MKKNLPIVKIISVLTLLWSLMFLNSCGIYRPVDAREYPPDPKLRVKKNMEEGRGFRLMGGGNKKGGVFDFASSNELWRASLDTIDFMPLVSANYSGGIIITDWYNEGGDESVKITIRFLSNEVRVDALSIKVFTKKCGTSADCQIIENEGSLSFELRKNILKKAAIYAKQNKKKNFKEYPITTPGDNKRE